MNNNNFDAAGFAWRRMDRTVKAGTWLRDLAIALAAGLALALVGMVAGAHAQQRIQILGVGARLKTHPRVPTAGLESTPLHRLLRRACFPERLLD